MSISPRCLRAAATRFADTRLGRRVAGHGEPARASGHRRRGLGVEVVDHHPRARRG